MDPTAERPLSAAEQGNYNGNFLRQILASLRLVAGPAYSTILRESGLEQYESGPPPTAIAPEVTNAVVARLLGTAYSHLIPSQYLLLTMNLGEHQARVALQYPEIQAIAAEVATVPSAEQVTIAWQRFNVLLQRLGRGGDRRVQRDAQHDYLVVTHCPYCQHIHQAARPVCYSLVRYYEVMLHHLTGRTVVVRETECAATGQAHCIFAVRRERTIPYQR